MPRHIGALCYWLPHVVVALQSAIAPGQHGTVLVVSHTATSNKTSAVLMVSGDKDDKGVRIIRFPETAGAVVHEAEAAKPLEQWGTVASVPQFGSLACMGWTGEWCGFMGCNSLRGPTTCAQNRCMCQSGYCASAAGVCEKSPGAWMSTDYFITFSHPANPKQRNLGKTLPQVGMQVAATDQATAWRIVISLSGYLRFEPVGLPGVVLVVTEARKPQLASIEDVHPGQASFRVRKVGNGSGLEIWDPLYRVSLASASTGEHGIGLCNSTDCASAAMVSFRPALPNWVNLAQPRDSLEEMSTTPQYMIGIAMVAFVILLAAFVASQLDAVKSTQYMGLSFYDDGKRSTETTENPS